jgi:hypothetical protein
MDKAIEMSLNAELRSAELDYREKIKDYGRDHPLVVDAVPRYIYHLEWWIIFAEGLKIVWFTPWQFFKTKEHDAYSKWLDLKSEAIWNKAQHWR